MLLTNDNQGNKKYTVSLNINKTPNSCRTKGEDVSDPVNSVLEETTQSKDEKQEESLKNSMKITAEATPKLLAWSSLQTNEIKIVELETQKEFTTFRGVQLSTFGHNWMRLKEIPNTQLLVAVNHDGDLAANLEAFDVSRKGQAKKIYSFEEVSGDTGQGDVTYNPRRNVLGAISIGGKVTYHLYNVVTTKNESIVKLARKSKWNWQYYNLREENSITGLDFDPTGERTGTLDRYSACVISDVSTNKYIFRLNMKKNTSIGDYDKTGRCRWSINMGEPTLFVKYDSIRLNVVDVEKQILILKDPIKTERIEDFECTNWIDVCPSNGNLLALGGSDKNVKIFDKRESKIIKTFEDLNSSEICSLRWSPKGDAIAIGDTNNIVKLVEFHSGNALSIGAASDRNPAMSVCFI